MNEANEVLVVGLGEVGRPLMELLSERHQVIGIDIDPPRQPITNVSVMHICYPFEVPDFVGITAAYVQKYQPSVTVINSTVAVGTTRKVAERTGARIVHSPVRGKHARMLADMRVYTKFVGALDASAADEVCEHFACVGLKTKQLASPEATELGKLCETTYFGVMIAWAQEVERYCEQWGASYDDVTSLFDEVKFFPAVKYFPGVIGGHCVMPNIEILSEFADSQLLKAVKASNVEKIGRAARPRPAPASLHASVAK